MASVKKWIINDFSCKENVDGLQDVVSVVHWTKTATETVGDIIYSSSMSGACAIALPDAQNFIQFADIKEDDAIAWLEATLDVATIDSALDIDLDAQKNPPLVSKKAPWITE